MTLLQQAEKAKASSYKMLNVSLPVRNGALLAMSDALLMYADYILEQNEADMHAAKVDGKTDAMLDRLLLTKSRIEGMATGIKKVIALPDPIGSEDWVEKMPNGLAIGKRRVPLGVIGIIYEARPNVTSDAISLCVKAGNAVLLRGGSDAIRSNTAIAEVLARAGYKTGLPEGCIQFIQDTSRESAAQLMKLSGLVDVLIPRGGEQLIRSVVQNATVPVIETGLGNCHVFIENSAEVNMARDIVFNAKVSRPAICNAAETLLIEEGFAKAHIASILDPLAQAGVELRGCEKSRRLYHGMKPAQEQDWLTEYHELILAVRVVSDIEEAITHINRCGTHHSESIVTSSYAAAEQFLNAVDAAAVYVNASTRFTDGEEFGFGAEIGISTQKLHARGPMGLHELTTVKYVVRGNGQIR
ncbi:MAG: glutamate-5-semialdehyde dehydrogenase [Clostridiales bacterium]|jgi:glutamate-5-semialdehyde dehydrogenase|nr:glutamate-5-semialdehyde dehydrogenase [Clostridiales bacterium]